MQAVVENQPPNAASARDSAPASKSAASGAEPGLRLEAGRFRSLVEQLPLSVYIDRLDDVSSNVYTSPQIEPMLGYSSVEWVENDDLFVQLLHPEDRERVLAAHHRTHTTREPLFIEYRLRTRDGRYLWVQDEARVVADGGEFVLQGYLLDITARREAEEQLRYQAFHDALTGLANRSLFTNRVEHALVLRSQQTRAEVAVLFLDLDDFKGVNDTLGHAAGDALLRGVGVRLREALSPSYTVARMGGDEFAVLIEEVAGTPTAVDAAERIVASLQTPFDVEGREVFVTASVGIAIGTVADDLLRAADVAMYRAKGSGKAQYVLYAPRMAEDLVGRLELVAELRRAKCEDEFVIHYQPVVDLESGAVVGVEALVRWQHPTRGLLAPDEFIPLAEETGKIVDLGKWVLAEACAQVARWRAETPGAAELSLNVNVSTRQVRPGVLVESVRSALVASGLPPEALTLELTESVLARRHEELRAVLAEVALLGVRLALDDFGTGYSSLSLLQDLPVHTLKVDRSFVNALDADTTRQGFVQAIVDLAQTLDVSLVAEGMETAAQTTELRRLGCQVGQGFHFSPPLGADEVGELLAAGACESLDAAVSTRDARAEAA
jgi:diguanylate cyclase (GGDEF)-like protein/PAS domain S-box-containing protein